MKQEGKNFDFMNWTDIIMKKCILQEICIYGNINLKIKLSTCKTYINQTSCHKKNYTVVRLLWIRYLSHFQRIYKTSLIEIQIY